MFKEENKPTLTCTLDVTIPKVPSIKHELDKVEIFANELEKYYDNAIAEAGDSINISAVKSSRTKVRKVLKTIEDNRKAAIKAFKEPITDFEETSKRIEKILKRTDGKLKDIVDRDKMDDPFAGLSIASESTMFKCLVPNGRVDEFKAMMKAMNIEIEEIK